MRSRPVTNNVLEYLKMKVICALLACLLPLMSLGADPKSKSKPEEAQATATPTGPIYLECSGTVSGGSTKLDYRLSLDEAAKTVTVTDLQLDKTKTVPAQFTQSVVGWGKIDRTGGMQQRWSYSVSRTDLSFRLTVVSSFAQNPNPITLEYAGLCEFPKPVKRKF